MKTKCYCVYCPKHPFFQRQREFKKIAGWHANMLMPFDFDETAGADVECLDPQSQAFYELDIDPLDFEFETCAYGDGIAATGIQGNGFEITAYCGIETYKETPK